MFLQKFKNDELKKRFIILIFIVTFMATNIAAYPSENFKLLANIQENYSKDSNDLEINIKTIKKLEIAPDLTIPQRSIVTLEVLQTQNARRWHKSGFVIGKIKKYLTELSDTPIEINNKEIFVLIKKYDPINKKEASLLATEIILTQGASFFAPGVDILYFFTKGAIQREKHPNWFKAGVSNAYENSICWFWLKGKTINLNENDLIIVKEIDSLKALELKNKVDIRDMKKEYKDYKKQSKKDIKSLKQNLKNGIKNNTDIDI